MKWLLPLIVVLVPGSLHAEHVAYSFQFQAYAPNAGGQRAYSLRRSTNDVEMGAFANTYLMAGGYPLSGGVYSLRHNLCDQSCFVQLFMTTGVGLSTAGPLLELSWASVWFWIARLDITTHIYITKHRPIVWSVPLWVGLSLPL